LTEKFAYERRVRESKLKAAMLQAKRQNAEFVEMLDKDEAYQHVKKRGKKRQMETGEGAGEQSQPQRKRNFRQLKGADKLGGAGAVGSGVVQSVFAGSSSKS
jgi:hypothetical protein